MSVIFRKLERKRHWDDKPWLEIGDVQADSTKCFETDENKLSVFVLDKPDQQIERVVAALAANRDYLCELDLAIVPEKALELCAIRRDNIQGETPDSEVNEWHKDFIELSISKIACLATAIKREGQIKRYQPKKVAEAIKFSLEANYFDISNLNQKLLESKHLKNLGIN